METNKQRKKKIYEENLKAMNAKAGEFGSEDIQLVIDQCRCTEVKAKRALKLTIGDVAKAIILITTTDF